MAYGGYHPYPRRFGRAAGSQLEVVHRSLNQQMGSGINASDPTSDAWLENMAAARCIVFHGWESNRRLSLQWDPLATTDMLSRWETIFALSPDPAASLASRHAALLGKWQAFGQLANDQLMRDLLSAALGPVFVDIEYIDSSKALVISPDPSYPWGVQNAFGVTWYSTVAHVLVKTQKPASYSEGQYYAAVAQVATILDPIRPSWATYDWYRAPVSPSLLVVGGPSASGFYLDDPHNLDNNVFSDPSAVYAAPTVTSVSPATGVVTGGTTITISGTAFRVGATADINGAACTSVVRVNSTTITAVTPASINGAGARSVSVTNVDTQSGTLANAFTYTGSLPVLTAVSATVFDPAGGDAITLTGTDMGTPTLVELGDGTTWSSCAFSASTATSCTLTTVAKVAGAYLIRLTTAIGTSNTVAIESWSPLQLTSALFVLDSGKGVIVGAPQPAGVVTWTDQTANAFAFVAASSSGSPAIIANAFGTQPALRFDRATAKYLYATTPSHPTLNTFPFSVYFVGRWTSTINTSTSVNNDPPLVAMGWAGGWDGLGASAGSAASTSFNGPGAISRAKTGTGTSFNDGAAHLVGVEGDASGNITLYVDGVAQGTDTGQNFYGIDRIGGGFDTANGWIGDIGAAAATKAILTTTERAKLGQWARSHLGTP